MRVLNLVHDDKFIDSIISEFDYFGKDAHFVVLQAKVAPLQLIKNVERVERVLIGGERYNQLLSNEGYDILWIHYLDLEKQDFVNAISAVKLMRITVVWSSWGWDLYCQLERPFLMRRTFAHLLMNKGFRGKIGLLCHMALGLMGVTRRNYDSRLRKCLKRINFASSIVPQEWPYLRRAIGHNVGFFEFFYAQLPRPKYKYTSVDLSSLIIWVGNSGTYSNNHFDVFQMLQPYRDYNIIAPLSYGSESEIIDQYGSKKFGLRWHPIKDFVPYDKYMGLMRSAAIFVFAHVRQQALGNVILALKMGGCVFMNFESPIVDFLRQYNIKVYSLDDLKVRLSDCLKEFFALQCENIKRSSQLFSEEQIVLGLKNSFNIIEKFTYAART